MTAAEIPRLQSSRVALYEQRFGKFDSGKNAYWSLRKERPVTLAEGARFDADMRAGRLAPVVRQVSTVPSGAAPMRQVLGYPRGQVMPAAPPQERLLHMPTEARRIDALPSTPPPGPARPPFEPLFEAIMRQLQEKQAGPAIQERPAFAIPGRTFASAVPSTPIAAGFTMKKLALPLALVVGAYVVSRLV